MSLSTAQLVATSDAVITVNSSVGFEAFFYDKPVALLGDAVFAPKNSLPTPEELLAGVPDIEMGHRVGALLVVEPGAAEPSLDDIRAWGRDHLASFKLPELIGYIDVLPVNELGKLPARTIVEHLTIANGGTT